MYGPEKSKLLYFSRTYVVPTKTLSLDRDTVIAPFKVVRFLSIWLDRKLLFREYL